MDIANLFKEDNDFNICKSWLCNSTDGQTYSLSDWFGRKLYPCPTNALTREYDNIIDGCFATAEWEDAIGWRHDFKVDGEDTDKEAEKMVNRLNDYIFRLNAKIEAVKRLSPGEKAQNKNKEIEYRIRVFLDDAMGQDYSIQIFDLIKDEVVEDVNTSADEEWSLDDVKLSIGRVLCKKLGLEY